MKHKINKEQLAKDKLNNQFFKAINNQDFAEVKRTLEAGADVNAPDNEGYTALQRSVYMDVKFCEYLLSKGASPNVQDKSGYTPLHTLAIMGAEPKAKILLNNGANMYIKNKYNETPFTEALKTFEYDMAELFVLYGYMPTEKDYSDIDIEDRGRISEKLRKTALLSSKEKFRIRHQIELDLILFNAIEADSLEKVKEAVENGADVNACHRKCKNTPLIRSVEKNISIVKYLLEHGALMNIDYFYCEVPLHRAAFLGDKEKINLLLQYDKDTMYIENFDGQTPFAAAVFHSHDDAAEIFVANGYVPTERDFKDIFPISTRENLMRHFIPSYTNEQIIEM